MAPLLASSLAGQALAPAPSSALPRALQQAPAPRSASHPRQALSLRCHAKADASPADVSSSPQEGEGSALGLSAGRRSALVAAAASAAALVLPLGSGEAQAANIVQRGQRSVYQDKLKRALAPAVAENQALIPSLLRLALNDALTYDKATKTGGANGSIRLSEELSRPENAGLGPALKLLESVKAQVDEELSEKGGPVSYADLIQFGAAAAMKRVFINASIEKAGGNEAKGLELYRATGSAGQWGYFDKQFGRADAEVPDPAGRVKEWGKLSPAELKAFFEPLGIKPRQITVLAIFLSDDLAAQEAKLAEDEEFQPWVAKYQKSRLSTSQTDYQVDLITAFAKFSVLGAPINTEAYTFEPPRLKFKL